MLKAYKEKIVQLENRVKQLEIEKQEIIDFYSKDSSTGFFTKRHLKSSLDLLIISKIQFCFAVIDLDNFKNVNDMYGHDVGDEVLKNVSNIIHRNVRDTDKKIRFGGDEFMLIFPNIDLLCAKKILERIRVEVESEIKEKNVTCSIGLTEYVNGDSVESVIRRSDSLMYAAKNLGKNRIVIAI